MVAQTMAQRRARRKEGVRRSRVKAHGVSDAKRLLRGVPVLPQRDERNGGQRATDSDDFFRRRVAVQPTTDAIIRTARGSGNATARVRTSPPRAGSPLGRVRSRARARSALSRAFSVALQRSTHHGRPEASRPCARGACGRGSAACSLGELRRGAPRRRASPWDSRRLRRVASKAR